MLEIREREKYKLEKRNRIFTIKKREITFISYNNNKF